MAWGVLTTLGRSLVGTGVRFQASNTRRCTWKRKLHVIVAGASPVTLVAVWLCWRLDGQDPTISTTDTSPRAGPKGYRGHPYHGCNACSSPNNSLSAPQPIHLPHPPYPLSGRLLAPCLHAVLPTFYTWSPSACHLIRVPSGGKQPDYVYVWDLLRGHCQSVLPLAGWSTAGLPAGVGRVLPEC